MTGPDGADAGVRGGAIVAGVAEPGPDELGPGAGAIGPGGVEAGCARGATGPVGPAVPGSALGGLDGGRAGCGLPMATGPGPVAGVGFYGGAR